VLQSYVYFIDVPRVVVIGSIPAVTWAEPLKSTTTMGAMDAKIPSCPGKTVQMYNHRGALLQNSSLTGSCRKTSLANDISLPIAEEDVNNLLAFVVVDHGCDSGKKPEVDNSRDLCVASMDGIKYDGKGHGISANRVNPGERLRSGRRRRGCIFVGCSE
jgi:hypothetical protein